MRENKKNEEYITAEKKEKKKRGGAQYQFTFPMQIGTLLISQHSLYPIPSLLNMDNP